MAVYVFEDFELDGEKVELRRNGAPVAVEPQVFSLLLLLVEKHERLVSKDEIIEKVWGGRIVSESAVTSRVKSARHALGDDGKQQRFIRTVHGSGFRFVADVAPAAGHAASAIPKTETAGPAPEAAAIPKRPSIAVLPFRLVGIVGPYAAIADALPHDLIAELSRLRWLFVIARGSSFRFRAPDPDIRRIGEALNVRYCLSGTIEIAGKAIGVTVELAATGNGGVVWGEHYAAGIDDIYEVRARIVASVISALEIHIPLNEARRARLASPENLDAWSVYHLGLHYMFRFNKDDNATAAALFERAIAKEPGFARAHAGLSFTHFQNAFLHYTGDADGDALRARRSAERSIELDPLDPFANFTMGRSFWLEGDLDGSLAWLDRSTTLNPNYAQGIYARAWTDTVSGRGIDGQTNADTAMSLSPLDPLLYAMLGTRALSHVVRGDDAEAVLWADRAVRAPGAHVMIGVIAVIAHALNGDDKRATAWAANVHSRNPHIAREDFFRSFPFPPGPARQRIADALAKFGL